MKYQNFPLQAAVVLIIAVMAVATIPAVVSDDSEADSSFTVTDGKGNTVTFDSVPEHIITIGKGVTATAIEVGVLDKIVVCDKYSASASESVYDNLKTKVSEGKIKANGTVYTSGKASLLTDIVDSADVAKQGVFDKESDAIFITGSDTYIKSIIETLKSDEYGFTKVLAWNDITDYADIVDFIKVVSKVAKGSIDKSVEQMENLSEVISAKLSGVDKAEAFYVTYSGGTFKVGNTGSLANSMIIAAGGNSITVDSSKSASTYETSLTSLVEQHPDAIIFIDNSINSNADYLNTLKTQIGGDTSNVVPLKSLWNNYCVESMDGVWTMACAMYPDIFSGDIPSVDDDDDSDSTMLYVGAGVLAVVIIGVIGFMFLRKH